MPKLHIKAGDEVKILAGKDKGKTGKVLQVFPRLGRVAVEGVNQMKRHLKPRASGQAGQAVSFSMPIHASNVALASEGGDKKKAAAPKKKA